MLYSDLLGLSPYCTSPSGAAGRGCSRTQLQPQALPSPEASPSLVLLAQAPGSAGQPPVPPT